MITSNDQRESLLKGMLRGEKEKESTAKKKEKSMCFLFDYKARHTQSVKTATD